MGRKRDLTAKIGNSLARPVRAKRKAEHKKSPRLAVVMFHRISDQPILTGPSRDVAVSKDNFKKYCEMLKNNFRVCTFSDFEKKSKEESDKPLLVISFDDGYTDFYKNAFPILKEFNLPVNQNLIVRYIDEGRDSFMNWDQVRELKDSGLVELGCHTYDKHILDGDEPILKNASREEVLEDLKLAKKSFEKELGIAPEVLAWPYGLRPENISDEELGKLGFKFQLNTVSGMNFRPIKYNDLKRFAVLDYETPKKLLDIIRGYDNLGMLLHK